MAGGMYVALSGMRTRMAQLDRVASDIANEGTAGYKGERASSVAVNRTSFDNALNAAVDNAPSASKLDFAPGVIEGTGRGLDVAIDGPGFLVVQTAAGTRYTRNGRLARSAAGTLVTSDGSSVMGQDGPITLPEGAVSVKSDGTVSVNGTDTGKLKVVDFADYTGLTREDQGRFQETGTTQAVDKTGSIIRGGALEQSNISMAERMAQLVEVTRGFEALQRGVSMLANDIDSKAISTLSRQ